MIEFLIFWYALSLVQIFAGINWFENASTKYDYLVTICLGLVGYIISFIGVIIWFCVQ